MGQQFKTAWSVWDPKACRRKQLLNEKMYKERLQTCDKVPRLGESVHVVFRSV